jgi:ParB/Sulfiredoxin domain
MRIEPVPISSIDTEDTTFLAGSPGGAGFITDSIREIGLISPPVLIRAGTKFRIVTGRKRVLACRALGYSEIFSTIYEEDELSPEECIKITYNDNCDRMDDMELSELVLMFRDLLGWDDLRMIKDALPYVGIPPSRKQYDRCIGLAALDREIKDAFYGEKITIEQCQMLSESALTEKALLYAGVIDKYRLNNNESRHVLKDIEEIALRDKRPFPDIMDEIEGRLGGGGKDELRAALRKMRYPALTGVEEKWSKAIGSLDLPANTSIVTGPFFEGSEIEIKIRLKSPEELPPAVSALDDASTSGGIARLFKIVREGV